MNINFLNDNEVPYIPETRRQVHRHVPMTLLKSEEEKRHLQSCFQYYNQNYFRDAQTCCYGAFQISSRKNAFRILFTILQTESFQGAINMV